MDDGGKTGVMECKTKGDDVSGNGVECRADEGCGTDDGKTDCGRSSMGGTLNECRDGSMAFILEREGHRFLAKAETAGTAAHSSCDLNVRREGNGDGLAV